MGDPLTKHIGLTQEILLHRIANRIRQSLELQEILSATVAEVRSFLDTDRVKIYQFQPDSHGLVIAESIQEGRLPPLLGLNFPADDIPPMPVNCLFGHVSGQSSIWQHTKSVSVLLIAQKQANC